MVRTLFFCMVLRKSSEITNNKLNFSQYNIFHNYEYFSFSLRFDLFSIIAKETMEQWNNLVCCSSSCFLVLLCFYYGPLQCFSTYFHQLKEVGVLRTMLFLLTMTRISYYSNFCYTKLCSRESWIKN